MKITDRQMGKPTLIFILIGICGIISGCFLSDEFWMRKSQERSERYVEQHPEINDRIKKFILNNAIGIGMTKEEVKLCVGYEYPNKIVPTTKYKADEMWIYDTHVSHPVYLYFKGNILVEIEPESTKEWHLKESERKERIKW